MAINSGAELKTYKECAESILELLDKDPPPLSSISPELGGSIQNLQQLAKNLAERASSPVKIGIMGEFSSGKTLLIGSLIGYADALPIAEIPVTGNITEIRLVQQPELQTTQLSDFSIEYLSQQDVKDCLKYMLSEIENLGIPPLRNWINNREIDTSSILTWCQQNWNNQRKEIRTKLRELVIFVRSYSAYKDYLCSNNKKVTVDRKTGEEALKLPMASKDILQLQFQEISATPPPWQDWNSPTPKDLQNSFSLIRRLGITVKIAQGIWDLSSLEGVNQFVILDFPGLGASESASRDTYLSLREIKEVQTILLLMNCRQPGRADSDKIRTMIEKEKGERLGDRILVGLARFNQLPLEVKEQQKIQELNETPLFPPEEEMLPQLPTLELAINSAKNLTTKKENIVLLSQRYGAAQQRKISSLVQVCSPEFAPELDQEDKPEEKEKREQWKQLSEGLTDASFLKKPLSDFVLDGGIGRLRSLLTEHVAAHGVKQLLEDTKRTARALEDERERLKNLLEREREKPIVESPALVQLKKAIENLKNTYRKFQQELERQPSLKNHQGLPISNVLKDEMIDEIFYNWSEWSLLLDRTSKGIITLPPDNSGSSINTKSVIKRPRPPISIPTSSDEFYSAFQQTIKEIRASVYRITKEATIEIFRRLSQEVDTERYQLEALSLHEKEALIEQNFTEVQAYLFGILLSAIDPLKQWQQSLFESSGLDKEIHDIRDDEVKKLFPLACKDSSHSRGQIFDWSPDKKDPVPPKPFNHQMAVMRQRRAIIDAAELHIEQELSQLNKEVKSNFLGTLKDIVDGLEELGKPKHEQILKHIASPEEMESEARPSWLETLAQIATISCWEQSKSDSH